MVDSTYVFGKLMMPLEAVRGAQEAPAAWSDIAVNRWLIIAAAFIFILNLNNFYKLFSTLWKTVFRLNQAITLENNLLLSQIRNILSLSFFLPLCIIVDFFLMPQSNLPAVLVAFLAYWLYKFLVAQACGAIRMDLNFLILMCTTLMVTSLVIVLFNIGPIVANILILGEMAAFLICQILQEVQFFRLKCQPLRTFLYLCALEILPLGVLLIIWPV